MAIGPVSLVECMIVLVLLVVVAAFAFRMGFFRGRGR
jgi:hypothetical protein